jgi:hypothetical protein
MIEVKSPVFSEGDELPPRSARRTTVSRERRRVCARSRAEGETELPEPMWDTGWLLPGHWAHREPAPHGDRRHGMSAADQAMLDATSSLVEVRAAERAQSNEGRMKCLLRSRVDVMPGSLLVRRGVGVSG